MSFDGYTATSWLRARPGLRGAFVLAVLALLAWTVGTVANSGSQAPGRRAVAGRAGAPTVAPLIAAQPGPALVASPPALRTAAAPAIPADSGQAESVTAAFLTAYATYRFDETPGSLRARLRPYDTDRLDVRLAEGGGAGTQDQRPARHQSASASVVEIRTLGLAPDGRLVLVGHVAQTVTSDAGSAASTRYAEVYLRKTGDGWRVDEVAL